MKAVILAGGFGTRLSEETQAKPKPMVEIGGFPIIWHLMKSMTVHGITEFIICLGYRGYVIKEFFSNYHLHASTVVVDVFRGETEVISGHAEPWKITLVDTGPNSMTGGRLARVKPYLGEEPFLFTYGDGLSDVDIGRLVNHHRKSGCIATVTAVKPPGRFGVLSISDGTVNSFREKSTVDGDYINGGFLVLEPDVFELIKDDSTVWEREPLESLANSKQLNAYIHDGFWHPMDTLRDKLHPEKCGKTEPRNGKTGNE